jgi:hypothetical protein
VRHTSYTLRYSTESQLLTKTDRITAGSCMKLNYFSPLGDKTRERNDSLERSPVNDFSP